MSPGGVPFAVARGSGVRRSPSLNCPPSGRAVGVRYPQAVGAGVRVWGPSTCPVACMPCEGLRAAGVVGGVWVQAPSLLWPSALLAGSRGLLATCCGRGCACVRRVWCLCGACRGAWCCPSSVPLVLPPLVLFCGVMLVVCLPCPLPRARPSLGCWLPLFLSWFRRSLPFPLLTIGQPSALAGTFSLPPPWCLSRSLSLPASLVPVPGSSSFSPAGSCETARGWMGVWAFGRQHGSVRACGVWARLYIPLWSPLFAVFPVCVPQRGM